METIATGKTPEAPKVDKLKGKFIVTREVKVPSGKMLMEFKKGQVISDLSQIAIITNAFDGNPPLRPLHELDME